jgi:hypothetical protein
MRRTGRLAYPRRSQFAVVLTAIVMLGLAISGCSGYANSPPANRGTATTNVLAQSVTISRATTVITYAEPGLAAESFTGFS